MKHGMKILVLLMSVSFNYVTAEYVHIPEINNPTYPPRADYTETYPSAADKAKFVRGDFHITYGDINLDGEDLFVVCYISKLEY